MNQEPGIFKKLIADHYDGDPWIEVNLIRTLQAINEKDAATKVGNLNTIWAIVNHMISWRETLLKRINNEDIPSPEDNFFRPVTDISSMAWAETVSRLQSSQDALLFYLSGQQLNMSEHPGGGNYTRFELIQGILQHDIYHLGQIVVIKKLIDYGKVP